MSVPDRFVREEYVGDNRCWPCTLVNAAIVALCALVLVVVSFPLALLVLVAGAAAIRYRGYVVPGTPSFAPRLTARLGLDIGPEKPTPPTRNPGAESPRTPETDDAEHASGDAEPADAGAATTDGDAVFDALADAGVLREDADGVALDPDFREAWRDRVRDVRERDPAEAVRSVRTDVPVEGHTDEGETEWVVVGAGDAEEQWLSPAVAFADVAAVEALDARGVDRDVALAAAAPLRRMLERCPVCDGTLSWDVEGCCGGYGVEGPSELLTCEACGATVASE